MFHPEETCTKTGKLILDVLCSNHPDASPLTAHSLEAYKGKLLAMVPMGITDATVEKFARQMLGSAGPGGVNLISL